MAYKISRVKIKKVGRKMNCISTRFKDSFFETKATDCVISHHISSNSSSSTTIKMLNAIFIWLAGDHKNLRDKNFFIHSKIFHPTISSQYTRVHALRIVLIRLSLCRKILRYRYQGIRRNKYSYKHEICKNHIYRAIDNGILITIEW